MKKNVACSCAHLQMRTARSAGLHGEHGEREIVAARGLHWAHATI